MPLEITPALVIDDSEVEERFGTGAHDCHRCASQFLEIRGDVEARLGAAMDATDSTGGENGDVRKSGNDHRCGDRRCACTPTRYQNWQSPRRALPLQPTRPSRRSVAMACRGRQSWIPMQQRGAANATRKRHRNSTSTHRSSRFLRAFRLTGLWLEGGGAVLRVVAVDVGPQAT